MSILQRSGRAALLLRSTTSSSARPLAYFQAHQIDGRHGLEGTSRQTRLNLSTSSVRGIAAGPSEGSGSSAGTSSQSRAGEQRSSDGQAESKPGAVRSFFNSTAAETALGASVGVILLGLAGMFYHKWYKSQTLSKMELAFQKGYDPVTALATSGGTNQGQLAYVKVNDRREDELIARILAGEERGRYFLILGPKGSGKTTAIIQAMAAQMADGVAFFEAHSDPSIVVDRFSEAINYTMNRDFLGNLVGLSDLSGMSTFQHLERALHKLETALIRRRQKTGRPAVVVMSAAHLIGQEEEGVKLLHVLQQRAEKWAAAGTATFLFTSNDYFVYDVLRRHSNRMDTLTFKDLNRAQSLEVLRSCRQQYWGESVDVQSEATLDAVYRITGGRLSLLNKVSRRRDMLKAAQQLIEDDMQFLLSKTGIIEDHDDDVMDEMKYASCSWLLFTELAKRQRAIEEELRTVTAGKLISSGFSSAGPHSHYDDHERMPTPEQPGVTESALTDPSQDLEPDVPLDTEDVPNPSITWGEARQVMTRPDFITSLDHLNLIHIDRHHHIRADSMPLLRAFARVALDDEDYARRLDNTMERVSAIESLLRTRELVIKEQGPQGQFLVKKDPKGREMESWFVMGSDERLGREVPEEP